MQGIGQTYVECRCPPGYTGTGIGQDGCTQTQLSSSPCTPNPCGRGTCTVTATGDYLCQCPAGYSGTLRELSFWSRLYKVHFQEETVKHSAASASRTLVKTGEPAYGTEFPFSDVCAPLLSREPHAKKKGKVCFL